MIGRRELGAKTVVVPGDTAIEESTGAWTKYREEYDIDELTIKPGMEPTFFTLEPMTRRVKKFVYSIEDNTYEHDDAVIRAMLTRVVNYEIETESGDVSMIEQPERKSLGTLGQMVTDEYMEKLNLPREVHQCLAIFGRAISEARPLSSTRSDKPAGDSSGPG